MTATQAAFFWCSLILLMGCAESIPDAWTVPILSFFAGGLTAVVVVGGIYVASRAVNRLRRGVRSGRGHAEITNH